MLAPSKFSITSLNTNAHNEAKSYYNWHILRKTGSKDDHRADFNCVGRKTTATFSGLSEPPVWKPSTQHREDPLQHLQDPPRLNFGALLSSSSAHSPRIKASILPRTHLSRDCWDIRELINPSIVSFLAISESVREWATSANRRPFGPHSVFAHPPFGPQDQHYGSQCCAGQDRPYHHHPSGRQTRGSINSCVFAKNTVQGRREGVMSCWWRQGVRRRWVSQFLGIAGHRGRWTVIAGVSLCMVLSVNETNFWLLNFVVDKTANKRFWFMRAGEPDDVNKYLRVASLCYCCANIYPRE